MPDITDKVRKIVNIKDGFRSTDIIQKVVQSVSQDTPAHYPTNNPMESEMPMKEKEMKKMKKKMMKKSASKKMKMMEEMGMNNPLTASGKGVMQSMTKTYGKKKGKSVFYASMNKNKKGSKKWHAK